MQGLPDKAFIASKLSSSYGDELSLQAWPEIPSHGWEMKSEHDQQFLIITLIKDWMTGSPVPEAN